ncbi:high-affinity Zn(2+) transporter zrt1 [Rhizophlyctis rosea]|nr:high-affinity Zn(2+) transporter zrt1 [Rhizophlyctis rosea]
MLPSTKQTRIFRSIPFRILVSFLVLLLSTQPVHAQSNQPEPSQTDEQTDPCASILSGQYDTTLHVTAVFVIMATSLLGTMVPLWSSWIGGGKLINSILPILKLFSTGVILSTALIHMYTPASTTLASECLPSWVRSYEALPSALVLAGMLITWTGQVVAGRVLARDKGEEGEGLMGSDGKEEEMSGFKEVEFKDDATVVFDPESSLPSSSSQSTTSHNHHGHHHTSLTSPNASLSLTLLKIGIMSHSVIIGIALGTAREEFATLLAAVSVHQFFEGVAVGSLVVEDEMRKSGTRDEEDREGRRGARWKWWMRCIWVGIGYSITTPLGIIIGIALNTTITKTATPTLLLQSFLDAIGAGILLYDGVVNVLVPHFAQDATDGNRKAKGGTIGFGWQVFSVWVGAIAMGIVGIWA